VDCVIINADVRTLAAAVTRRTLAGRHPGGWLPEQKMTLEEAVRAYMTGLGLGGIRGKRQGQPRSRQAGRSGYD
jgi:hypothetical protein